jgi:hypothetical protein
MRSSRDAALSRLKTFASLSKPVRVEVEAGPVLCTLTGVFVLSQSGFECNGKEGSIVFDPDEVESAEFNDALAGEPSSSDSTLDEKTGVAFSTIVLQGGATVMMKRVSS